MKNPQKLLKKANFFLDISRFICYYNQAVRVRLCSVAPAQLNRQITQYTSFIYLGV